MTLAEFVKSLDLFKEHAKIPTVEYPETAQDGGTPATSENMHPEYFTPDYPNKPHTFRPVGVLPTTEHKDAHWLESSTVGHTIPYVGEEPHGEEIDTTFAPSLLSDIDLTQARGTFYGHSVGEKYGNPIPVFDVPPPMFGYEKKLSTNLQNLVANTPIMLCGKRPDRTQARVFVLSGGQVYLAQDQASLAVGFAMPTYVVVTFVTNQPIWVTSTAAAVISVVEEYIVIEGDNRL